MNKIGLLLCVTVLLLTGCPTPADSNSSSQDLDDHMYFEIVDISRNADSLKAVKLRQLYRPTGKFYNSLPEHLIIPATVNGITVEAIAENAFKDVGKIKSIDIPDTVIKIGSGAFDNCIKLVTITSVSDAVMTVVNAVLTDEQKVIISVAYTVYNETNYDFYTTFKIYTAEHLNQIANLSNNVTNTRRFSGKTVTLMNDIDLGGGTIHNLNGIASAVGSNFESFSFNGIFDGNNKTVSGFIILVNEARNTGFIGQIGGTGSVKNLTVKNGKVTNSFPNPLIKTHYTGGIVGRNFGLITNCTNDSVAVEAKANGGGIAGRNFNTIEYCANNATVTCIAPGIDDSITTNNFGGITGMNSPAESGISSTQIAFIKYSKNFGIVSGLRAVGGITGGTKHVSAGNLAAKENGIIEFCFNSGDITGYADVAGISGYLNQDDSESLTGGFIRDCYNAGIINITSNSNSAGGIVGYIKNIGTIQNCYNIGTFTGQNIGAIVGKIPAKGIVNNSYFSNTDINGVNYNDSGTDNSVRLDIDEFGDQNKFTNWDFTKVWKMGNGLTGTIANRPVLRNNEEN